MNWKLAGCSAFLVVATLACGPHGSGIDGPAGPEPVQVAGKLVDAFSRPVEGATVVIAGQPPTVTDERGGFLIGNVSAPYELTVIDRDSQGHPWVFVYAGLTRRDPTIVAMPKGMNSASIRGRISGPNPVGSSAAVAFSSSDAIATSAPVSPDGSFAFSDGGSIAWPSTPSISGILHVLRWQTSDSGPIAYSYGRKDDLRLEPGASLIDQEVQLHPVAVNELRGVITQGSFSIIDISLYLSFDEDSLLAVLVDSSGRTQFTYKVPDIPGAACLLVVRAQSPAGLLQSREWGECRGDWAFAVGATAPELLNPGDGFAGLNNETEFGWNSLHLLYEVDLIPENSEQPRYLLRTSERKMKLPDLSSAGLPLPSSANYRWQVRTNDSFPRIDDLASGEGVLNALEAITNKPLIEPFEISNLEVTRGESSTRQFTTAQ